MARRTSGRGGGSLGLVGKGGDGFRVGVHIDATKGTEEFKEARREFNRQLKAALKATGEEVVLPEAKRRAMGLSVAGVSVPSTLVVRPRSNHYLLQSTLRGKKNRALGLLEFGGAVITPILPRKKNAIAWASSDHPVASVKTKRKVTGKKFLMGAVDARESQRDRVLLREMLKAFDGFEVSH